MKQSRKQAILIGLVIIISAAATAAIAVSVQEMRHRREMDRLAAGTSGLRKVIAQYMTLPAAEHDPVGAARTAEQEDIQALLAQCRDLVSEARYDEAGALAGRILKLDPKKNEAKAIQLFVSDMATPPPWKAALEKKLEDKVTFDFVETPFSDVTVFLSGITNTNIIVDEKAMRDLEHTDVTLKVTDMELRNAFRWALEGVDLRHSLRPEGIYVTSAKNVAAEETTMHPYDVIYLRADAPFSCYLFRMPGPQGYRIHGADGQGHTLKISGWEQPWQPDAPKTEEAERGKTMPAEPPTWLRDASRKLERKVTFDFVETPLRDVVAFMQQISGANIILSERAVAGLLNPEVTLKANDMKLGQALYWILDTLDLVYVVRDEAIHITTAKRAAEAAQQSYYAANVTGEIRAPGGETEATLSGCLFYHLPTGGFFVLGKDADGNEIELKGMKATPLPAEE